MVNVKEFVDSYADHIFNNLNDSIHDLNRTQASYSATLQMIPCTKCGCYFAPSWADTPPHDVCPYCKGGEKND